MPTYSYRCTECATAFDIHQAFTDDTLTECPSCAGKLRKVFSSIGVTFTGSGFYRNDSRSDSKGGSSTIPATSSSSSSSSSSAASSAPAPAAAPAAASSAPSTSAAAS